MAIQSFAAPSVERFVEKTAARKLDVLHYAEALTDLASPPGNRLEALKGDLKGSHSIRINDQWRIVFRWTDAGPVDVDITRLSLREGP